MKIKTIIKDYEEKSKLTGKLKRAGGGERPVTGCMLKNISEFLTKITSSESRLRRHQSVIYWTV